MIDPIPPWYMGEPNNPFFTFTQNDLFPDVEDPAFWTDVDDRRSWRFWEEDGKFRMEEMPKFTYSYGWHHVAGFGPAVKAKDIKVYIDGELYRGLWRDRAKRLWRFITRRYPRATY